MHSSTINVAGNPVVNVSTGLDSVGALLQLFQQQQAATDQHGKQAVPTNAETV